MSKAPHDRSDRTYSVPQQGIINGAHNYQNLPLTPNNGTIQQPKTSTNAYTQQQRQSINEGLLAQG
jgi:hypothetical protein